MINIFLIVLAMGMQVVAAPGVYAASGVRAAPGVRRPWMDLTLDEKAAQMATSAPAVERLGIGPFEWVGESVHGLVAEGATVFPQAIALAATWDPEFVRELASAMSDEARVLHRRGECGLVFFSPVLNMARDPRWGRTQETYGEDPLLVSRMGVAFVRGLQGDDPDRLKTAAVVKHFVANNEEDRRHNGSASVPARALYDYYLPQFRAAIVEGKAAGVMCAYNALNGTPCCANRFLLAETLRDRWGFEGFVVTDCGAIGDIVDGHGYAGSLGEAAVKAIEAGVDLECGDSFPRLVVEEVRAGRLPEATVDRAVERLMRIRQMLGEWEGENPYAHIPDDVVNGPAHRALALTAARKSIVMLRNPGGILPFPVGLGSVAVIGPSAAVKRLGNYSGWGRAVVTPLDGIRAAISSSATVGFARGCHIIRRTPVPAAVFRGSLRAWYFDGTDTNKPAHTRRERLISHFWSPGGRAAPVTTRPFVARWAGTLHPPKSGKVRFAVTANDGVHLSIGGKTLVDNWHRRPVTTDTCVVELEKGKPVEIRLEWFSTGDTCEIELGWDVEPDRPALEEAVLLAGASDACVVVVGTDRITENEGADRRNLSLPGDQAMLIREVTRVNPRTVVVLECGSVVKLDWMQEGTPAVLQAWFPGEAGGTAIADVIFGKCDPGGRLPLTWYAEESHLPPVDDYDVSRGWTYMYLKEPPAFPFGFGMSYSRFAYSELKIRRAGRGSVAVSVDVQNIGSRRGDEVVQCYISGPDAGRGSPGKELKDFKRITLSAGRKRRVEFVLGPDTFSRRGEDFELNFHPGHYVVMAGPNSSTGLTGSIEVF